MGSNPPTPRSAIAPIDHQHHGQHPNCRPCGTSPRARGTNPRGLRPPDPPPNQQPSSTAALTEWTGPEHEPADGPLVDDPTEVHTRLEHARAALAAARKPPMGPPPIPTRGAVHR